MFLVQSFHIKINVKDISKVFLAHAKFCSKDNPKCFVYNTNIIAKVRHPTWVLPQVGKGGLGGLFSG